MFIDDQEAYKKTEVNDGSLSTSNTFLVIEKVTIFSIYLKKKRTAGATCWKSLSFQTPYASLNRFGVYLAVFFGVSSSVSFFIGFISPLWVGFL